MKFWATVAGLANYMAGNDHANRDPADDFWFLDSLGMRSLADIVVTPESAQTLSTFRACLKCLADPIASLPIVVYRRRADGSKERLDAHPIADLLRGQFTDRLTATVGRGTMQWHLAMHSNAYAEIQDGGMAQPVGLRPLHPDHVRAEQTPSGSVVYKVREPNAGERTIHEENMFHLRVWPLDPMGVCGVPMLAHARDVIGKALALQMYASRYFANDAQTGGIIEYPQTFKTPTDRRSFLAAWRAAAIGMFRHRDRILENGAKYNRFQVNNEHAQFLETEKQCAVAMCQLFLVPPHKVGLLDKATFSNIEQQSLEFVTQTLLPWLVAWEQAIKAQLILEDDVFLEFNVAGLLRGDLKARYEAYAIGRNWGWLSVNDVRAWENMNPLEGGDVYLEPLNMQPAGDEKPAPENQPTDADADEEALAVMQGKGSPNAHRWPHHPIAVRTVGGNGRLRGDGAGHRGAEVIPFAA